MIVESLEAEYVQLPLRNPFVLSIRSTNHANIVRWTMTVEDGRQFKGECVPVQYVTGETVESAMTFASEIRTDIAGLDIRDSIRFLRDLERRYPSQPAARAGVEIAVLNAFSAYASTPLHKLFGGALTSVTTDITVSKVANAVELVEQAWRQGFRHVKLKVGGEAHDEDLDRILELSRRFPDLKLSLDGNQGFVPEEAIRFLRALTRAGVSIELVEQPVLKSDLQGLDEVAKGTPVPIFADEACLSASDAYMLFQKTAIAGVNVKVMKSGVLGALDIVSVARAAGRKLMIGCMIESEIGLSASLALACGTGAFSHVDLDGHLLIDSREQPTLFHADGPVLSILN